MHDTKCIFYIPGTKIAHIQQLDKYTTVSMFIIQLTVRFGGMTRDPP